MSRPDAGVDVPTPVVVVALMDVMVVVLAVAAARCEYSPGGSTASWEGSAAIAETFEFLPAQEQPRRLG